LPVFAANDGKIENYDEYSKGAGVESCGCERFLLQWHKN